MANASRLTPRAALCAEPTSTPDVGRGPSRCGTAGSAVFPVAGGLRCPLGAHVRRANPRDALGFYTERTRRNRIIRRGMPYVDKDGTKGLIFVCFNASIARQFEQIQGHWLMSGDTFGLGGERDFLIAGLDPGQASERMTIQGNRARPPRFIMRDQQFVTVRGGHCLFVPGIAALRRIAGG